jgi:hypothetical protein
VLVGDLLADDDSGDGGAATVAGFGSLDAFTRRADGSIVVAADGRLRVFAPGGIIAPLAGTAGAGEGFADGPAALARFANVVGLVEDGSDGSLLVVEPTSVRRFDATTGTVSTLVADQFVEDGPLGDARLARPGGIACADGACVVDDDASRTLRRVSFVDGAVATLRGSERAPFDAADVAVRAGAVVASLPSADRIVTLGATADDDVTFAQGNGFVTAPTALCGIADGNAGDVDADADDVLFVSQATTLRRVGAAVAVTLFADASDAIVDVAAEGDDACFVTAGDVRCLAASLVDGGVDDAVSLQASTSATAVAIAAGHVFFADDDGVHRVPLAGGAPVTLVSSGTQALPFAGCVGGLAIDGDAVFATDGCTGSLIRIAFE